MTHTLIRPTELEPEMGSSRTSNLSQLSAIVLIPAALQGVSLTNAGNPTEVRAEALALAIGVATADERVEDTEELMPRGMSAAQLTASARTRIGGDTSFMRDD